ncbi:hypothetical protein [Bacillus phage YungSlug]|nr:hypothetical protein [Bacillus phage YungSlug]
MNLDIYYSRLELLINRVRKGEVTLIENHKEVKVTVRQFLTKSNKNPVPMRIMFGYVERETPKAVYVHLRAKPVPSTICLRCARTLKHPVSLLYGVGPECGGHYHVSPLEDEEQLEAYVEKLRENMKDITWEGWLPKGHIQVEETGVDLEIEVAEPEPEPEKKEPELPPVDEELVNMLAFELKVAYES